MSTDSRSEAVGRPAAWSPPGMRESRYSQSLERGLAVLGCFTLSRPVLGIANIASDLGMSRPTTHRYVTTLAQLGYLERDASRKYRLGLRVTELGMSALSSTGLREHAHPYLWELHRDTNFTVGLGILDGGEIVYVDRLESSRPGQHKIDLGLQADRVCRLIAPRSESCCSAICRMVRTRRSSGLGFPSAVPTRSRPRGPWRASLSRSVMRAWPWMMRSSRLKCRRSPLRFAPKAVR